MGPILGGQLVGKTASSDSSSSPPHPSSPDPPSPSTSFFLDEYPFILVCSVGAILSIISLIITLFFLKEGRQSNQPPLKKISNLSELFGILRLIFFPGSKSSFSSSPSLNDGSAAYTRILQASDEDLALHPISNNGSSASSNSNPNSSGTLVKNCTSSISREVIFQLDSEEDSDGGGGAVGDHVDDGELGPRSTGRSSTRIISAPRNRSRSPLKDDQNQQLQQQQESVMLGIDVDDKNDDDNNDQHNTIPPTNSLLLPSAILPISLYCCIACVCMIYSTAIPLYFSSSLESGGLALTASQSSIPITTIALSALLLQMSPFYKIVAKYGSSRCYSVAMSLLCPCLVLIPAVGSLTSSSSPPTPTATFSSWFQIASLCAVMIPVGFGEAVSYQSVILMITESVPVSKLGITHGFACTAAAVVRTLSPTITGILWEMGVKMGWSSFAFFVACLLACLGVFGSSYASPMKRHLDGDPLIGESR